MGETPSCIYCGPGKLMSREDVIPYALGGRYSSSEIICKDCNSYFGAEVDHHVTDWHLSLVARDWFDLEGRSGSVPRYAVEAEDGTVLTVGRKGDIKPKWRDVKTVRLGRGFSFTGGAPTIEEAQAAIAEIIAKETSRAGRPPTISESRVVVHTRREWKPFEADVEYDYRKQGRAIAKMAFHYLATQLDRRFLRVRDFEPISRFVRYGEHGCYPRLCQPAIPQELESMAKSCIQHTLTLRCSHELRSAVSDVALFGVLRFSVVLSYSYEGPDLFRRLVMYPLEARWEETAAPDLSPIPARLILHIDDGERQARYRFLEKSVHSMIDWLNVYGVCYHIRETLPAVISETDRRLLRAEHGGRAWLPIVANEFSNRSSPAALVHFLGEPSRVAAEVLIARLHCAGELEGMSSGEVEERFARLVLVRLLVDALASVARSRSVQATASDIGQ
jgi:hypothetical protein